MIRYTTAPLILIQFNYIPYKNTSRFFITISIKRSAGSTLPSDYPDGDLTFKEVFPSDIYVTSCMQH